MVSIQQQCYDSRYNTALGKIYFPPCFMHILFHINMEEFNSGCRQQAIYWTLGVRMITMLRQQAFMTIITGRSAILSTYCGKVGWIIYIILKNCEQHSEFWSELQPNASNCTERCPAGQRPETQFKSSYAPVLHPPKYGWSQPYCEPEIIGPAAKRSTVQKGLRHSALSENEMKCFIQCFSDDFMRITSWFIMLLPSAVVSLIMTNAWVPLAATHAYHHK